MEDETGAKVMKEIVLLKPTMYSCRESNGKWNSRTAKYFWKNIKQSWKHSKNIGMMRIIY